MPRTSPASGSETQSRRPRTPAPRAIVMALAALGALAGAPAGAQPWIPEPVTPPVIARAAADGAAFVEPVPVMVNGPNLGRINLVFMGDGFTVQEMPIFVAKVDELVDGMFEHEPFRSYRRYFNIYRLDVRSQVSGVSGCDEKGSVVESELGVIVCRDPTGPSGPGAAYGLRLLEKDRPLVELYASVIHGWDQIFIIPNCDRVGPIVDPVVGEINVLSLRASAGLLTHVMGHTCLLADEPLAQPARAGARGGVIVEPWPFQADLGPRNLSHFDAVGMLACECKWSAWLGTSMPGFDGPTACHRTVFEFQRPTLLDAGRSVQSGCRFGAGLAPGSIPDPVFCLVSFPSLNSAMSEPGRPFNLPGAEAVLGGIYGEAFFGAHISPIDGVSVTPEPMLRTEDVEVFPMRPLDHELNVQWSLDGEEIPGATDTLFMLDTVFLSPGAHQLSVRVWDDTPWVRDEMLRETLMTAHASWNVLATPTTCETIYTSQPVNAAVQAGGSAHFSVQTDSIGPCELEYSWRRDYLLLLEGGRNSGTRTPNLTISNLTHADDGAEIWSEVWNGLYHTESRRVILHVAPCLGDANADLLVDFLDLNILLGEYAREPSEWDPFRADFNGDRRVDFLDLNLVLGAYASTCAR